MILSAALYIKHHPRANLAVPEGSFIVLPRQILSAGYKIAVLDHQCSTEVCTCDIPASSILSTDPTDAGIVMTNICCS